jgi:hypothetical protein
MRRTLVVAVILALLAIPPMATTAAAATPKCMGFTATKVGTNGADVIYGSSRRDVIVSKGGADRVFGRGGKDIICTGGGNDRVSGGPGGDRINSGTGNDNVKGDGGYDRIDGGPGSDKCNKGSGGAKLKRCEKADLAVTVNSPEIAAEHSAVPFSIVVTNNGPAATSYKLVLANDNSGATCSGKDGGTYPRGTLAAGKQRTEVVHQTCEIDSSIGVVWLTASVKSNNGIDPIAANNTDTSSTTVKEP